MDSKYLGRYEFHDEKSHKYWDLSEDPIGDLIATWGRIGADGQRTFYTYEQGEKKAREKLAKGYVKVDDGRKVEKIGNPKPKVKDEEFVDIMAELRKIK